MRRVMILMLVLLLGTTATLLVGAGMAAAFLGPDGLPSLADGDIAVESPWSGPQALGDPTGIEVEPAGQLPAASGRQPAAGGQRPAASRQRPVGDGQGGELPPGVEQIRELRRRVRDAADLGRRAVAGDAQAAEEVARRSAGEADPRVRAALATGEEQDIGRFHWAPPVLPAPAKPAEAGEVKAWWLTPDAHDGTYESTVSIGADGRAMVDTVFEPTDGGRWHVRYPAWAFRDAQGRLVIDARGQSVECLEKPPHGWWSPDSMVISQDGLIDLIDDKHDPGQGTNGADGPG